MAKAGRDIPLDAEKVAAVYAGYETLKANRDGFALLDFDDLLLHTAAAIENDAAVAAEFRTGIAASSSTSTRTSPAAAAGAAGLAGRP